MKEKIEQDFWIIANEVYNNNPDCRLRKRNLDTSHLLGLAELHGNYRRNDKGRHI